MLYHLITYFDPKLFINTANSININNNNRHWLTHVLTNEGASHDIIKRFS